MSLWRRLFGSSPKPPPRRAVLPDEPLPVDPDADYLLGLLKQSARSPHSDVASRVGDVAFFAAVERLVNRGQERLAADLLGRFVMLRPDHARLLDRLAELLARSEDLDGAEHFYRQLASRHPEAECRARVRLAELLLLRGQQREARDELELVLARDVRFPGVRERLEALREQQPDALATVAGPGESVTLGRFRLRGELGRGGSGIVYRAYDPGLEREVAVKMLYQSHDSTAIREEVELVARLRHPNLIAIYDFDLPTGVVVMELCRGGSLRTTPLQAEDQRRVLGELAAALAFLHEAGIVHGDLKPDNVLFRDATHQPVLTDFGLAQQGEAKRERTGGTVGFVAPEVVASGALTPAADVYSFGRLVRWLRAESGDTPELAALSADDPRARPPTATLVGLVNQLFRS